MEDHLSASLALNKHDFFFGKRVNIIHNLYKVTYFVSFNNDQNYPAYFFSFDLDFKQMTLSPFHVLSNIFIGGILCYLDFIVLVSKWPLKKHCGVDTTYVYYVFLFLLLIILLWYTSHNKQGEK